MTVSSIAIIGAGRVGQSLGRALVHAGCDVTMVSSRGLANPSTDDREAIRKASTIIISVPDDLIAELAATLNELAVVGAGQIVLHTSGVLDREALSGLTGDSTGLGSLHPLMAFSDPAGNPDALMGAPAIIEGGEMAIKAARELATLLQMSPIVEIEAAAKIRYHAAAVFASGYLVVLAGVAERLAAEAGVPDVRGLFGPLMSQTLKNLMASDPTHALTGPVARGDDATVALHMSVLDGETRELYALLTNQARNLLS